MVNPTGYTALDFIGFTDKGTYATNVAYVKNDIVHYAGNLWRCLIDDTTGVAPAEGANWTVFVGEPTNLVERIIAPLEQNPATIAYGIGRQIIYDDYLWEVIKVISIGDSLIDYAVDPTNANIKKADPVETQLLAVKAKEGILADLTTTAKNDLVSAINEVDSHTDTNTTNIGTLSSLTTTAKNNVVAAINEVDGKVAKTEVLANNAQQMIAPIQSNLTASKAYEADEQFIYNGLLYKVTAAIIQQGGTITIGGNCELADSVTEQIREQHAYRLGSYVDLSSYTTANTAYRCPHDGLVIMECPSNGVQTVLFDAYSNAVIGVARPFAGNYNGFMTVSVRKRQDIFVNISGGTAKYFPYIL